MWPLRPNLVCNSTGLNQRTSSGEKNIQRTDAFFLWQRKGAPVSRIRLRMIRSASTDSSAPLATGRPASCGVARNASPSGRKASSGQGAYIAGAYTVATTCRPGCTNRSSLCLVERRLSSEKIGRAAYRRKPACSTSGALPRSTSSAASAAAVSERVKWSTASRFSCVLSDERTSGAAASPAWPTPPSAPYSSTKRRGTRSCSRTYEPAGARPSGGSSTACSLSACRCSVGQCSKWKTRPYSDGRFSRGCHGEDLSEARPR
mmetsp:Transcript_31214/g.103322  ORF Transcript_31214/g.103322 Transcript_31214/m.103322 type:complete len:261 (-) Transcript_31214:443-1225(-)